MMYRAVGANTNSSYGKMYGTQSKYRQKSFQLSIVVMEKQSTRLNYIIYPKKHNGTVISYEARTKQLVSLWSNFGLNNYNPRVNYISCHKTLPVKCQSYFWLVVIKMVGSQWSNSFNICVVSNQNLFVMVDRLLLVTECFLYASYACQQVGITWKPLQPLMDVKNW